MSKQKRQRHGSRAPKGANQGHDQLLGRSPASGWLAGLLVIAGALAYANSLSGPFVYDDKNSIVENEQIRELWPPWAAMSPPPRTPVAGRPVVNLSLAINYALGELDVRGYHVVNVALHILCALVLFGIVRRTLLGDALRARFGGAAGGLAFSCALIWMVHPLQTETTNYISQRTESIMGLFYLLTLYCAVRCSDSRSRYGWSAACVSFCALGMASKEVMVTAPLVVVLYDRTFRSEPFATVLRNRWSLYTGLAMTWGVLLALMWSAPRSSTVGFSTGVSAGSYALNQCRAIVDYLRLAVWPHPLIFSYGSPQPLSVGEAAPYMVVVGALLVATTRALVYRPRVGFLGAWVLIILAPTSSFIPIATEVAAERRMYLPLAGLVVLAVITGHDLLKRVPKGLHPSEGTHAGQIGGVVMRWAGPALVIVLAVATTLTVVTVNRNQDYRTSVSLWRTVVDQRPENEAAQNNLGLALSSAGKYDEAIDHFRKAVHINPGTFEANYNLANELILRGTSGEAIGLLHQALRAEAHHALAPNAHNALGVTLVSQGNIDEAIIHYRRALEVKPDFAEAHYNLGIAYNSAGKVDQAIDHYREALRLAPDSAEAHYNLGNALLLQENFSRAISHYRQALRLRPDYAEAHYNLSTALNADGQADEALTHLREAIRLKPDSPLTLNRMAQILVAHPDANVRDAGQAITYAERAAELTQHQDPAILLTLAEAYAAGQRFSQAVATAEVALKLASTTDGEALTSLIRERRELYRQYQRYRDPF